MEHLFPLNCVEKMAIMKQKNSSNIQIENITFDELFFVWPYLGTSVGNMTCYSEVLCSISNLYSTLHCLRMLKNQNRLKMGWRINNLYIVEKINKWTKWICLRFPLCNTRFEPRAHFHNLLAISFCY